MLVLHNFTLCVFLRALCRKISMRSTRLTCVRFICCDPHVAIFPPTTRTLAYCTTGSRLGVGKGSGKYAAVTALLIGLTAFLSVLLLSPRFGGDRSKFPVSGKCNIRSPPPPFTMIELGNPPPPTPPVFLCRLLYRRTSFPPIVSGNPRYTYAALNEQKKTRLLMYLTTSDPP